MQMLVHERAMLQHALPLSLFSAGAPIGERLYSIKAEWDDKVGQVSSTVERLLHSLRKLIPWAGQCIAGQFEFAWCSESGLHRPHWPHRRRGCGASRSGGRRRMPPPLLSTTSRRCGGGVAARFCSRLRGGSAQHA